jgi:hypothetical protein
LPRPIVIPEVMKLATLDDVRVLLQKHLPAEYRGKFAWRQLAAMLRHAAGGKTDCAELATALRLVLKLEGVTCQWSGAASHRPPIVTSPLQPRKKHFGNLP